MPFTYDTNGNLAWQDAPVQTLNSAPLTLAQQIQSQPDQMYNNFDGGSNKWDVKGGKYIVTGWICTVSGTPGTFKESRVLTGG